MQLTKWDFISDSERETLSGIRFGAKCSGCGVHLETEADFARHFIVNDSRYLNLGECPKVLIQLIRETN